ncbi:MAG: hypothetical protein ACR2IE_14690 [Candidatus Sumerlaeaceae bacterium]
MKSIHNVAAVLLGTLTFVAHAQTSRPPTGTSTGITTSTSAFAVKELQPQNVATGGLTVTTTMTAGVKPQVAFPATPAPRPAATTMTQAQLDDHVLPRNILSQTSDVIALSYNGFRRSQLDPCGCVSHQLGGLDKEARVLHRMKDLGIPVLVADAGGYVRDNPTDTDLGRTRILLQALHAMGATAANVGFTDISGGVDKIKSAAETAKIKLISANVADTSGKLLFDPYYVESVKTTAGEVKVAFVGVTRPRVPVAKTKTTSGTVATPVAGAGQNDSGASFSITDPGEALLKYIPEARQKADLVVALVYDRRDKASELLKDLPAEAKVDIAISGEFLTGQANILDVNGTKLVSGGFEGRQTGLLTFSASDKKVVAASNQFIEILQTIPTVPEITRYVVEAKSLTTPPAGLPVAGKAPPVRLGGAEQNATTTGSVRTAPAEKGTPAKLDLGKE